MLLRSSLLANQPGVLHGFTGRVGGVSEGQLSSLNLARRPGEQDRHLTENWRRVLHALGAPEARVAVANQVHGDRVLSGDGATGPLEPLGDADAVLVTRPGQLAAVRVADCVPVLLSAPGGVAAVHAGWRGTALGIVTRAVEALCDATGAAPAQISAAIGPCIGPCCYSVGEEVGQAVSQRAGDAGVLRRFGDTLYVDLAAANESMLRHAGVWQVDTLSVCTRCSGEHFSHRGDGPDTGRQIGIIGISP